MNEVAKRVLLTGATGFVGRHLYPALLEAGLEVVCGSRNPEDAEKSAPDKKWVHFDLASEESIERALEGVDSALYLVHHLNSGPDYVEREKEAARTFVERAEQAKLRRVAYLGGVEPRGNPSRHLQGRLETGRILRGGSFDTYELRASMVIGAGSDSFTMVSDLAARLPAMILPQWLQFRSRPVAIDDVVAGLVIALTKPDLEPGWYDIPGPGTYRHVELLEMCASLFHKKPRMIPVPLITPTLSSYWIAGVTRMNLTMAKELVQGLQSDLVGTENTLWSHVPGYETTEIPEAMRLALNDEGKRQVSDEAVARLRALVHRLPTAAA